MSRFIFLLAIFFFAVPLQAQTISLQPVVSGLQSPVGVYNANDGSGRLFFVQQGGAVRQMGAAGNLHICCRQIWIHRSKR